MSEEGKKISFGFSKLTKPKVSITSNNKEVKKDEGIQFIDCVEDKSIKVKNEEPKKPDYLVIPLPNQRSANVKNSDLLDKILCSSVNTSDSKTEERDHKTAASDVSTPQTTNKLESLDEIAAREIIEDLKKVKDEKEEQDNFSVPLTSNAPLGEKEPTLDDYESIPVDKFGMAMLRGMGWAPGKGIGKNEKVVAAQQPVLRPKGLGLGADKVIKKEEKSETSSEMIKLVKGSFVRIIAGAYKDLFGEVIGFDDETGRLIIKMTLGGAVVTFNEFMVQPISKEDFNKNSRVINVKKFEEYKNMEDGKGVIERQSRSDKRESSEKCSDEKLRYKSGKYRTSSVSSNDSDNETQFKKTKAKHQRKSYHSPSPENSCDEDTSGKSKKYRSSARDTSPQGNKFKNHKKYSSRNEASKSKYYNSPDKYTTRHSRESSRKHASSSDDDSSPARSKTKKYDEYISHKNLNRDKNSRSSRDSSSAERYSGSRKKQSRKCRKPSSSSVSSSDESYRKRKEASPDSKRKKNKGKKKSKRRSRSFSNDRKHSKRSPSPKKRKKVKKSKYDR